MLAKNREVRLLLSDVRSVHNVGSIFRTAETLGISTIYCAGTTPTPLDRFGQKRKDFAKVALGSESMISWQYAEDATKLIKQLKAEGFETIALEQDRKSLDYKKIKIKNKTLIIIGSEVGGISRKILNLANKIAEIPIVGKKESLNVSVATGIFLYRMLDE